MDLRRKPAPPPLSPEMSRCVGRERELASLEGLFRAVSTDGRGRLAWVVGPGGIGKSRLLQELKRRLQSQGTLVLEGRAREGARAYQPVLEVVEAAARSLSESGAGRAAARAVEVAELLKGRITPLGVVPPAGFSSAAEAAQEGRRLALYERVAGFLGESARIAPLAILIHDLHLADGASRALLHHLAQTRFAVPELDAPVEDRLPALLVVTSREGGEGLPAWLEGVEASRVELGALDLDGVREFLQSPEVVRFVAEATGGQPQALESLLETRPADADERFRGLFARLSPAARRLLGALAVWGRPTGPDALRRAAALGVSDEELAHAVTALVEARLVAKQVVEGELRLAIARPVDEEAAYRALADEERVALHRAVGRAVLARGDDADLVAAAEHLCRGGAGEEAVNAALAAGERLEVSFGYDRAIALYRSAWAISQEDQVRATLEMRMVELKRLVGDYPGALEDAERVRRRQPDDPATLRIIGQLHLLRDDFARAGEALARARELAIGAADGAEVARVLAASAEVCLLEGRHADAREQAEAGLQATTGEDAGAERARLRLEIRNTLGKVHLAEGRYAEAALLFAENLDEARLHAVPFEEARALINQGIASLRLGDQGQAAECYRAALRVAETAEDHRHRAFALQNLGVLAHWRHEYGAALRYFQDAVAAFKKIGQRGRLAWIALDLASLYLDIGAVERAQAMAALADRLRQGDAGLVIALKREIIAGRIARGAAELTRARTHLSAARDDASRTRHHEFHAEAALQLGWMELEHGDADAADRLVAELLASPPPSAETAHAVSPLTRARALLLGGEVALARGDGAAARGPLLEAVDTLHRLGDLDGEWRAHFALARASGGDHAESERRLRLAQVVDAKLRERVPEEFRERFSDDPARRALTRALGTPQAAESPARRPARIEPAVEAHYHRIVGKHARIRQIFGLIEKVAPHDSIVLIRGESGTGKELVADAIHARSRRARRPIVKVNCGALVETLLLSELFGHERGAFTGAVQRKIGRFEAAHHGTIFLDEIGDVSPRTQAALLRVIQERQFERVGSTTPVKVDVRIICATNRDLESMVARGEFREDLYYRLKGIQIDLPPLRERASDVPLIAEDLLVRIAAERAAPLKSIAPEAMELLLRHHWPGNVRELENVIRSVSLFAEGQAVQVADFADYPEIHRLAARPSPRPAMASNPAPARAAATVEPPAWERMAAEGIGLRELQERIEVECITRALAESRGNITKAAELLKMKRPRLSQLIKEYGIAL